VALTYENSKLCGARLRYRPAFEALLGCPASEKTT